jgi:hypothetical protein
MDMAANRAIQLALADMVNNRVLKIEDEIDGSFYLALGIAGKRPVSGAPKSPAQP